MQTITSNDLRQKLTKFLFQSDFPGISLPGFQDFSEGARDFYVRTLDYVIVALAKLNYVAIP